MYLREVPRFQDVHLGRRRVTIVYLTIFLRLRFSDGNFPDDGRALPVAQVLRRAFDNKIGKLKRRRNTIHEASNEIEDSVGIL